MGRKKVVLMPNTIKMLKLVGEQIKLARLRREIPVEMVAELAGVSRATVWKVENGDPSVSMGNYAAVLHGIGGMDKDLLLIAKDDVMGRTFQDLRLKTRKRAPKN